jgi:hypothetical protein
MEGNKISTSRVLDTERVIEDDQAFLFGWYTGKISQSGGWVMVYLAMNAGLSFFDDFCSQEDVCTESDTLKMTTGAPHIHPCLSHFWLMAFLTLCKQSTLKPQ